MIHLNSKAEEKWWKNVVKSITDAVAAAFDEEEPKGNEFADLVKESSGYYYWGFDCDIKDKTVWLRDSEGCPNLDGVANLIQAYMKKFGRKDVIHFQWAETCSKPRLDSYGGGAFIITASQCRGYSSGMLIKKALDGLSERGTIILTLR